MPAATERQQLERILEFLYQCPVGLLEMDEACRVAMINPAASRMLMLGLAPGERLDDLTALLERVAPDLLQRLRSDPTQPGPVGAGTRVFSPGSAGEPDCVELRVVRLERGRVMLTLADVSDERRVARREHEIAEVLQAALAGRIDTLDGLDVGTADRSAGRLLRVGGHWVDAVDLGPGRAALVVGDVPGDDLAAAAAMGPLRWIARAMVGWEADPAAVVSRADEVAAKVEGAPGASLTVAVVDVSAGRLFHATAGAPPPLLVQGGAARWVGEGTGPQLATGSPAGRRSATTPIGAGDTVVLTTTGLVVRGDEAPARGAERLRLLATAVNDLAPAAAAARLVDLLNPDGPPDSDICVLVARVEGAAGAG